ncbi:MAG TPA: hypothetical protein VII92_12635 [Anaerolineae bacterium]
MKTYQGLETVGTKITEDVYTQIETRELARLRAIENAALRVASSRDANGIVTDARVLDQLDAVLEARS